MVNDLKQLLRDNVADAPADHLDLAAIVSTGHRRVRVRRTSALGGLALAVAAVVAATAFAGSVGGDHAAPAEAPPTPEGPVLRLADAPRAVEGRDYEVLASYTNRDLEEDDGRYFDGVTDDGLILFRDGPIRFYDDGDATQASPRFALMNPTTGEKDWLPELAAIDAQTLPSSLGRDQLVFLANSERADQQTAYVFDRADRSWRTLTWPTQPRRNVYGLPAAVPGPDGRLYFLTGGQYAEPEPPGGEGGAYDVWSLSLTDDTDVRDEQLSAGEIAFTPDSMVWTDATMGDPGRVHVRDLATGEEHTFDPRTGENCDLVRFAANADHIVLGESCGTHGGLPDERVHVVSIDGDQVVTVQDDRLNSSDWHLSPEGDTLSILVGGGAGYPGGTYVYDLAAGRFLRFGSDIGRRGYAVGPAPSRQFVWSTPTDGIDGMTQRLVRLPD